jgi:hypothetical protein
LHRNDIGNSRDFLGHGARSMHGRSCLAGEGPSWVVSRPLHAPGAATGLRPSRSLNRSSPLLESGRQLGYGYRRSWARKRLPSGLISVIRSARRRWRGAITSARGSMPGDEWVTGIELRREDYGTHSLRRTKSSIIYKQTGNLRAVQILLGHAKIESTFAISGSTSRMHSPSLRYRGLAIS